MEADWEIEIAADAPVIDAHWVGLADLRANPNAVTTLKEAQPFPPLGNTLLHLNGSSPGQLQSQAPLFRTTKCDLWTPEFIDYDEMEAGIAESTVSKACYIDLIPEDYGLFASLQELESKAREIISNLRAIPLHCSRVDLVLRQVIAGDLHGFGITAYITVCGPILAATEQTLEAALNALAEAISPATPS